MKNLIYSTLVYLGSLFLYEGAVAQMHTEPLQIITCADKMPNSPHLNDLFISSFMQTKFPHLTELAGLKTNGRVSERVGISVDGPDLNAADGREVLKFRTLEKHSDLWVAALEKFEAYEFDLAKRMFYKIVELNPLDEFAKFYLALSQLYLGEYGPAANKLSVLNKFVSLENNPEKQFFRDDIKFYFAWSSLKVTNTPKMALVLFKQLNYEGGKYQDIAKEMINLLRL